MLSLTDRRVAEAFKWEVGGDLDSFVYGTLVGCIGAGKDSVLIANQDIRRNAQFWRLD